MGHLLILTYIYLPYDDAAATSHFLIVFNLKIIKRVKIFLSHDLKECFSKKSGILKLRDSNYLGSTYFITFS